MPQALIFLLFHRIPLGELAPPPPKIFFGREDVIEKVVDLAENLASLALIGPGGIGKTSVALTVLHHDRIRERFGDDRRFIRCDQFPASRTNLLGRLSSVIGAGVENPEGLAPLRSFLSSREILIVLDNAESILDPQGTDGKGIYNVVKELSQFNNIFLLITSRITTIPPDFHCLSVPALSMDAARSTLHRIYDRNERPDLLDKILRQLDFHPLSVTLLATVARENNWDNDRLYREWEKRQTGVLRTEHNDSLAAAVELSLDSPMFKLLGPNAQELLGVIAFYPQGVGESADWLFTSIPNKDTILDKLCILSLTYRSNGYITMLAPLRDHFCPQDPESSPLLCATKELYFTRLIVPIDPNRPGFSDGRWIMSEDVNIEHLLDVFTSIDSDSKRVWDISAQFVYHLSWYKPRQTMLRSRIEELLDDHRSKPVCLLRLSELSQGIGNYAEQKRLLMHALKLNRERENDGQVANTLYGLSTANRRLGLYEEGIQQAKEALEIYERLGIVARKGRCSISLAHLLYQDNQLGAAEEVVLRTIKNLPEKGQESQTCDSHRLLGDIYRVNNEGEKALHHYNKALHIASSFDWSNRLGRTHHALAQLFHGQGKFDDAQAHIEQAKQHTADDPFPLSNAMELCAEILYGQERFEDARLEALRALEIYRKVGATKDMEYVRALLRRIDETEKA